ncbi:hypothetical protein LP416_27810 [Polaromonas sp. P2-4]|nr:hypothetical protein LP416_27810 [Polaromonas sp. P2-4]
MPRTKDELRLMVEALDLSTEAGRATYTTLLSIAPEFAATTDALAAMAAKSDDAAAAVSKLAQETATKLLASFTAGGALVPALDVSRLKLDGLTGTLGQTGAAAGYISTLFLDASSGLLGFGGNTQALTAELTDAQTSAALLDGQIAALRLSADRTRIDFVGLGQALAGVDTDTFVATIGLVFDNLAARIAGVIDSISTERIAVRDAALQIVNPTVMGKAAIERQIGGINTALPSNAWLTEANRHLAYVDSTVASVQALAQGAQANLAGVQQTANPAIAQAQADKSFHTNWLTDYLSNSGLTAASIQWAKDFTAQQVAPLDAVINTQTARLNEAQAYVNATAAQASEWLGSHLPWAVANAKNALTAYTAAIQDFSIDASKSVGKLSKLREETVRYYEAQKALADLMSTSAAGLRGTVADYRYAQMTPQQQYESLGTQFNTAYAMALSTSGETLAGYGDKLNSLLNPLLEKGREIYGGTPQYAALEATMLARAEAIAARLDALTPTNYAADSLSMLGQIDATLAALDASSKSAEKIIADAVAAGSEKTAAGLRAVIAAVTGQTVPAFASGGYHAGGLRIVGENGPELEATGPSRIFNASQTHSMLRGGGSGGGSTARLEALVERLTQEVSNLRNEARATAVNTNKTTRILDRAIGTGNGALAVTVIA